MNPATLKMALSAASAVREHLKEYNEKKSREAYDLLSDAASRVDLEELKSRSSSLLDEGRREAGLVTQAAHARLDAAKKRLEKASENRPSPKKVRAAKRRRTLTIAGLIALLLSAIAGGVYWFTRQQEKPGDTPPRVEDFAGTEEKAPEAESTLVYSTTTPEEGVPAEVDEELLNSLDEQLEKHRSAAMDEADEDLGNLEAGAEDTGEAEEEGVDKK